MQMQRLRAKLVAAENALSVAKKQVETERQAKEDARRVTLAAAPCIARCAVMTCQDHQLVTGS
jgi:hypothetical protein